MKTVTYDETQWQLVPVEPNDAQQLAGAQAITVETTVLNKIFMANRAYRDMVREAPAPPEQQPPSAPDSSASLLEAAKDVVRRWDTPMWKDAEPTGAVINRLRAAIAAKEQP